MVRTRVRTYHGTYNVMSQLSDRKRAHLYCTPGSILRTYQWYVRTCTYVRTYHGTYTRTYHWTNTTLSQKRLEIQALYQLPGTNGTRTMVPYIYNMVLEYVRTTRVRTHVLPVVRTSGKHVYVYPCTMVPWYYTCTTYNGTMVLLPWYVVHV
jgi:hypothetical protein